MQITKDHLVVAAQDFSNVYHGVHGPVDLSYYDKTEWITFGIDEMLLGIKGNSVYFNVQGTDEDREWKDKEKGNLNFWNKRILPLSSQHLGKNEKIKVHPGHYNSFLTGKDMFEEVAENYENIFFHTHSRGAGISNIASRHIKWMIDNKWKKSQKVINITGGSPRSYNWAGADEYNKCGITCIRMVYRNDIVSNTPWPIMGYKHVGLLVRLGKPYIPSPIGIPWDHRPIKYIEGVNKLVF